MSMISALSASSAKSNGASPVQSGNQLTEQDFLNLLVAQLQNQNPAQPANDQQLAMEMASFSTASGVSQADATLSTILSQISNPAPATATQNATTTTNAAIG